MSATEIQPRTYPLVTVLIVAILGLAIGIGAGMALGRSDSFRRSGRGGGPPPARPGGETGTSPESPESRVTGEEGRPKPGSSAGEPGGESIPSSETAPRSPEGGAPRTPEETIELLTARVAELEGRLAGDRTAEEAAEEAGLAFEDFLRLFRGELEGTQDLMNIAGRLDRLRSDLSVHFAERLREAAIAGGDIKAQETALFLAILSGGPETSHLLGEILAAPNLYPDARKMIIDRVGRPGDLVWNLERLPPTDPIRESAFTLAASSDAGERRAGAGLLGRIATPEARSTLETIIRSDPDLQVRLTAIASLGAIGDAASLSFLKYRLTTLTSGDEPPRGEARQEADLLQKAIERLEGRLR